MNAATAKAKRPRKKAQGPLAGVRVLVTRARAQASQLSVLLRKRGAQVIEIPSIEIRPPRSFAALDAAADRALHGQYDWLIFTSVNGVEAFFARLDKRSESLGDVRDKKRTLAGLKVKTAAIGPATRAALEARGLHVSVTPKRYVAESVVAALRKRVKGKRILLARAAQARDVIPVELRRAGAHVDVVAAYETIVPRSSRIALQRALASPKLRPHAITFTSSSTIRNFIELLGADRIRAGALKGIALASIGPITSTTLREVGLRATVEARQYTMPGLVKAICRSLGQTPMAQS